ncbi:hypothetical protein AVEN_31239-1, partial [Araneus ventricosus]
MGKRRCYSNVHHIVSYGTVTSNANRKLHTSKEMIEKLDSIFKLKSDFNKMLLLDKFHQLKMECNETVVQYISKVENLAHQVKDAGET